MFRSFWTLFFFVHVCVVRRPVMDFFHCFIGLHDFLYRVVDFSHEYGVAHFDIFVCYVPDVFLYLSLNFRPFLLCIFCRWLFVITCTVHWFDLRSFVRWVSERLLYCIVVYLMRSSVAPCRRKRLWTNFSTVPAIAQVGCGELLNASVNISGLGSEV